ncbi:MAG: glutaredoxin family protein [Gammaproteobacteria bacterium]
MPDLTVFTRRGCHLCEVLIEQLMPIARGRARIHLRDVDSDPDLAERYGLRVPVVEAEGEVLCEFRLDRERVTAFLERSVDSAPAGRPPTPPAGR